MHLDGARRILVIGPCGAGKSTLARALAPRLGLPLVHLDRAYWRAGWREPSAEEWDAELGALLAGEAWVMDGNYGRSLDRRLAAADTAIVLDYPRTLCLSRVLERIVRYSGRTRPDLAPDCPERFHWGFLAYVWHFRRDITPRMEAALARDAAGTRILRFRDPERTERWLEAL